MTTEVIKRSQTREAELARQLGVHPKIVYKVLAWQRNQEDLRHKLHCALDQYKRRHPEYKIKAFIVRSKDSECALCGDDCATHCILDVTEKKRYCSNKCYRFALKLRYDEI